jgi:hypothetical protein
MDFAVLPLKDKKFIDTGYTDNLASAAGYIYLNDPVKLLTAADMIRFDIFYSTKETGGGDFTFFNVFNSA